MIRLSEILFLVCALEHIGFFVLESFLWKSDFARKRFQMSKQKAEDTAPLAVNQGVYNLFLAAGIIYTFICRGADLYAANVSFFLGCIVIAGLVGGATVNKRIFFVQSVPALAALILFWVGL